MKTSTSTRGPILTEAATGASVPRHISGILAGYLAELLDGEGEIATDEAEAVIRDWIAQKLDGSARVPSSSRCRCDRPWEFQRTHCTACGRDLQERAA